MNIEPITADQAKAVRKLARAKGRTGRDCYMRVEYRSDRDAPSTIDVCERIDHGENSHPRETTTTETLPALTAVDKYRSVDDGSGRPVRFCGLGSHYTHSAHSPLRVLANVIRTGDVLRVRWLIGNDTDNLRNANLTHDQVFIEVWRGVDKSLTGGKIVASILVDDRITPTHQWGGPGLVDSTYGERVSA